MKMRSSCPELWYTLANYGLTMDDSEGSQVCFCLRREATESCAVELHVLQRLVDYVAEDDSADEATFAVCGSPRLASAPGQI